MFWPEINKTIIDCAFMQLLTKGLHKCWLNMQPLHDKLHQRVLEALAGVKNAYPQLAMMSTLFEQNMSRSHETNNRLGDQEYCGSPVRRKHAKSQTRRVFLLRPWPPATRVRCGGTFVVAMWAREEAGLK